MNRFLRRSAKKKAFTMVELIVVIAIIGVLAAMILPNMLTSDVPVKAKGYAKDYFFVAQEFFSRQKIAADADPANSPFSLGVVSLHQMTFYTELDRAGHIVSNGALPASNTNMITAEDYATSGASPGLVELIVAFDEYMDRNLPVGEREGYLYCVVDDDFRVQVTYWSEENIEDLVAGDPTLSFTEDDIIGGYWCAAFPSRLSEASGITPREMFEYH